METCGRAMVPPLSYLRYENKLSRVCASRCIMKKKKPLNYFAPFLYCDHQLIYDLKGSEHNYRIEDPPGRTMKHSEHQIYTYPSPFLTSWCALLPCDVRNSRQVTQPRCTARMAFSITTYHLATLEGTIPLSQLPINVQANNLSVGTRTHLAAYGFAWRSQLDFNGR
ncbi:hypothetical protein BO86DRAFT_180315 [Aspergillus japonicus CBS 114.51]|uniref:Uncharacterized protein n=1 Tax=Aspergillus japonicus CBS 114.51 TaxID=1448312 RepID=A0A8T8WRP1_ASPJA|nr:hypothetical protein BO86DRAFT_180315 [Aspergillus japonicus CBS 114.51]RAH78487.1 hypothetical protein BO86DRAFT_180315 [Aspergillus japonicus CBS 114.51]